VDAEQRRAIEVLIEAGLVSSPPRAAAAPDEEAAA
jgi:hypothetical protein